MLVALLLAACGGDGATNPPATDPNVDRLEILFAYAPGALQVPTTMDLFQSARDGRLITPLISTPDIEVEPEWSRDGSKLVFTRAAATSPSSLWIANADGSGLRQLVVDPIMPTAYYNNQWGGTWSPDGSSIAFARQIGDTEIGLAAINADGTGLRWILKGMDPNRPSWSVDGVIAFGNSGSIWTIKPDGTALTRLTTVGGDYSPRWSRDGTRLVFMHSVGTVDATAYDVVTTRADGSDRRTLVTGGNNIEASWSPDGQTIVYQHVEYKQSAWWCTLHKIPSAGGTIVNLTPDRGPGTCGGVTWRPF